MQKAESNKDIFHIVAGVLLLSLIIFFGGGYLIGLSTKETSFIFLVSWSLYLLFGRWMPRQKSSDEMEERVNFMTKRENPNTLLQSRKTKNI